MFLTAAQCFFLGRPAFSLHGLPVGEGLGPRAGVLISSQRVLGTVMGGYFPKS